MKRCVPIVETVRDVTDTASYCVCPPKADPIKRKTAFIYIYCDMDGVITNFLGGARKILGKEFSDPVLGEGPEKWGLLSRHPTFWLDLPWMPGAEQFWHFLSQHHPYVLSVCPPVEWYSNSKIQKEMWCEDKLNIPARKCITVEKREHKQLFATGHVYSEEENCYIKIPNLLIDDHPQNVAEWIEAGGVGIVHYTIPETMSRLLEYGL